MRHYFNQSQWLRATELGCLIYERLQTEFLNQLKTHFEDNRVQEIINQNQWLRDTELGYLIYERLQTELLMRNITRKTILHAPLLKRDAMEKEEENVIESSMSIELSGLNV